MVRVGFSVLCAWMLLIARTVAASNTAGASAIAVNLDKYGDFSPERWTIHLDFGRQVNRVWFWWSKSLPPRKLPSGWLLVDTNGHVVASSLGEGHVPQREMPDELVWGTRFTNAMAFAVDGSRSRAVCAYSYENDPPWRSRKRLQMVSLEDGAEVIWTTDLGITRTVAEMLFVGTQTVSNVLVGFKGSEAALLNPQDGMFLTKFTYGPVTPDDALERKKRFGMDLTDSDPALRFSASVVAATSKKGFVAAGCSHDQRIRIIRIEPPFPMVAELNADKNPQEPKGGIWRVERLEFSASGNYLIAEYFFAGRGTRLTLRPTEIYQTKDWKKVWQTNDATIRAVTLSPDDAKMAFIQDNCLKITSFQPAQN